MLAAAQHTFLAQSMQELARVNDYLLRIVGYRARTHERSRRLEGQVEDWGEIHVES